MPETLPCFPFERGGGRVVFACGGRVVVFREGGARVLEGASISGSVRRRLAVTRAASFSETARPSGSVMAS